MLDLLDRGEQQRVGQHLVVDLFHVLGHVLDQGFGGDILLPALRDLHLLERIVEPLDQDGALLAALVEHPPQTIQLNLLREPRQRARQLPLGAVDLFQYSRQEISRRTQHWHLDTSFCWGLIPLERASFQSRSEPSPRWYVTRKCAFYMR